MWVHGLGGGLLVWVWASQRQQRRHMYSGGVGQPRMPPECDAEKTHHA